MAVSLGTVFILNSIALFIFHRSVPRCIFAIRNFGLWLRCRTGRSRTRAHAEALGSLQP